MDKNGLPYALHPIHLAEQMRTESATVVALLHDVVEDTDYTLEDLQNAGFPPSVVDAVALLTHDKAVPYLEYIKAIKFNSLARGVKLADLRHNSNLARLDIVDQKAMERIKKYAQAIKILEPRFIEERGLYQRCYAMSAHQRTTGSSHLPFEPGYYVTEDDVVLKVDGYSIYRLEVDVWLPAQYLFSLWYGSMTSFVDIPLSVVEELGLKNVSCPAAT